MSPILVVSSSVALLDGLPDGGHHVGGHAELVDEKAACFRTALTNGIAHRFSTAITATEFPGSMPLATSSTSSASSSPPPSWPSRSTKAGSRSAPRPASSIDPTVPSVSLYTNRRSTTRSLTTRSRRSDAPVELVAREFQHDHVDGSSVSALHRGAPLVDAYVHAPHAERGGWAGPTRVGVDCTSDHPRWGGAGLRTHRSRCVVLPG